MADLNAIDPNIFAVLPVDIQEEVLSNYNPSEKTLLPRSLASSEKPTAAWSCRSCTFLNHPQLIDCEMCGTLGVPLDHNIQDAGATSEQQLGSKLGRTLRRLRVPSTSTLLTFSPQRDHPAEELLGTATSTFQLVKESWTKRRSRTNSAVAFKPSLQAMMELRELAKDLTHKLVAGDEWLETSLERLWRAVGDRDDAQGFEKARVDWVALGFQNASPETDFRGGGVLALKCLLYAFEAHPTEMRAIQEEQTPDSRDENHKKRWYPVCVAGINLTCLLAGLLQLGDGQFSERKEVFWQLFQEPAAFHELFFLAFVKMDAIWHRLNATYMEFGVVLKVTQKVVTFILNQAPATLMDLREASNQAFLDRFLVSLSVRSLDDWESGECPDPNHTLETEDNLVLAKTRATPKSAASTKSDAVWPFR